MARFDPAITSFNGGELSPYVGARPDTAKYASGCKRMFNYLPRVSGAAVRRPGTIAVGAPKTNQSAQLVPFEANTSAITVLEVAPTYLRFWDATTRSPILNNAGTWAPNNGGTAAELAVTLTLGVPLSTAQSNDVMWICDGGAHYPQKLSRIATYQFQIAQMGDGINSPGPFKDVDPTQTITLQASAQTGTVTLTAGASLFAAKHIGEYWRIEAPKTDSVQPWETNKSYATGAVVSSNGRNYVALTTGTSGTVRPSHSIGARYDGQSGTGVQWDYSDDNYGEFKFTAVGSGTSATATVIKKLPKSVTTAASTRWARAAWNVDDGYPVAVCFYQQRLAFARGQTVWTSVAGDYENFQFVDAGQTTPDLALTVTIAARKNDRALWLDVAPSSTELIVGTANGPYAISSQTQAEPFGPGNVRARPVAGVGCAQTPPIVIGTSLFFVQRGGGRVRRLVYDYQSDNYLAEDMHAFASHIPSTLPVVASVTPTGQIARLVSALSPDPVMWMFGSFGANYFHSLTYDGEQQVAGWGTHQLGGVGFTQLDGNGFVAPSVVDAAAVLSPNGKDNDVWMLTTRFGHGNPSTRRLEILGPQFPFYGPNSPVAYDAISDVADSPYLDYQWMTTLGTGIASIPASYIGDGYAAAALVDGYTVPDQVITAGAFPLPSAPKGRGYARIGFSYLSILHPMPSTGQSATGSPVGKRTRTSAVTMRLYNSVGGRIAGSEDTDATSDRLAMRSQSDPMNVATPLKSGDFTVSVPDGWHGGRGDPDQAELVWIQDQPLPSNVLGMFPQMQVADA